VELLRGAQACNLGDVPARVFSEVCRDVDEALALGMPDRSFVPSPSRVELLRQLGPLLGLADFRVESDHAAFRVAGEPERVTLHNARPTAGELLAEAEARALAPPLLPFDDDGGVAAVLVGRIAARAALLERAPQEGT
jgi:hypothetical protein